MLIGFIHRLFQRRHYWRYVSFSELAELYAAELIRTLGLGLVSVLVIIYMYQNGYSLVYIALFYAAYSAFRVLITVPLAHLVGIIGPKHGYLTSNLLLIPMLISLSFLPTYGIWALMFFGATQGIATTLYFISYYVNFSKIKHSEHAGKEIGYVFILRRVAASLSPLIGGFIAYLFGPQATMYVAVVLFLAAAVPLLQSAETTSTHQKVTFTSFNWRKTAKNLRSMFLLGMDSAASLAIWPLFVAIAIFGVSGNDIYAKVGAITSVTVLSALLVTHIFGRVIDKNRGGELLRYSAIGNAAMHALRPFVQTPYGVVMTNVANEAATTGMQMPFVKAMFDTADSLPGYRIAYLAMMELFASLGAMVFYLIVAVCAMYVGEINGMRLSYLILAPLFLIFLGHGFKMLRARPEADTGNKSIFQAILNHK
jgi:MFS family permease